MNHKNRIFLQSFLFPIYRAYLSPLPIRSWSPNLSWVWSQCYIGIFLCPWDFRNFYFNWIGPGGLGSLILLGEAPLGSLRCLSSERGPHLAVTPLAERGLPRFCFDIVTFSQNRHSRTCCFGILLKMSYFWDPSWFSASTPGAPRIVSLCKRL